MRRFAATLLCGVFVMVTSGADADVFELVTGVDAGMSPGPAAFPPNVNALGDGQRLAGTSGATPAPFLGNGTPFFQPNQFGSLSFMFRRGVIPGAPPVDPILGVDYLGGPLLDLDGDLGNGSRSLVPVSGQSPVAIPGSAGFVDLSFSSGSVSLNDFDASASNVGFPGLDAEIATTVNTLSGTQADGSNSGAVLNPTFDTRSGTLTGTTVPEVTRIEDLGYEIWQDGAFGTAGNPLGTLQYLGSFRGFLVERDSNGDWPTLAGEGLGSTLWPAFGPDGQSVNLTGGGSATITTGLLGDDFTAPGNGGDPLTDFAGDLGQYFDEVVIPTLDENAQSFVYLESAGFGANNSADPVFGETVGYDMVLVGQFIPEPGALTLALAGGVVLLARRRRSA